MLILPQGRRDDLPCPPHLVRGDETGDGDPKQPHGSFPINQSGKQRAEDGQHLLCHLEALCAAGSSGHQFERAPADLERQRSPGDPQFGQAALHLECKILQDAFHLASVADIVFERHFLADRFALAHRLNRSAILAAGKAVELPSVLAKQVAQSLFTHMLQVRSGLNAQLSEFCRSHLAHPEELLDGQGLEEDRGLFLGNDGQSIGLVGIGGDLGQELTVGDARGGGEFRLFPDLPLDFLREPGSFIQGVNRVGHIEVRFVQTYG